jgi:hypothetical protein
MMRSPPLSSMKLKPPKVVALTASRQACIDTVNPLPVGASTLRIEPC